MSMWRSRIFRRFFVAYSVLLIVSFGLLGWMLIRRMESQLMAQINSNLETRTLLLRDLVNRLDHSELEAATARLARQTNARITLISASGQVIADSAERPENMQNHLDRIEIRQAAESGLGAATRYSGTVSLPMRYVARRNDRGAVRFVRIALPVNAVLREMSWLPGLVWSATGIALLVSLGLSLVFARRIRTPLVTLSAAADSIARGNYGAKVPVSSLDEVGALAASFNAMSEACASQIAQMEQDRAQLRAIFRSMVEGVLVLDSEQAILFANEAASHLLDVPLQEARGKKVWQVFRNRQMNEAVEQVLGSSEPYRCELEWTASEAKSLALHGARLPGEPHRGAVLVFHDITHLRKLERVRQDFIANVSHELKTPLAAIQATVETLLDGALQDADNNVRFLERVRENAERLHRLVQDLLTLGRIESNQSPLMVEAIDLQGAVQACLTRHADRTKARDLELIEEPAPQPIAALADEDALAEILDNLVDNAIKYTPQGGRIGVRWFAEGNEAVLQVSDTGPGIPEADLPRIFERFYRVDKARSRELGGTGLGLSIVKHLVQSLGGAVTAESEVGRGSRFTVRLPRPGS